MTEPKFPETSGFDTSPDHSSHCEERFDLPWAPARARYFFPLEVDIGAQLAPPFRATGKGRATSDDDDEAHGVCVSLAGGAVRPDPRDRRVRTAPATPTVRQGARPANSLTSPFAALRPIFPAALVPDRLDARSTDPFVPFLVLSDSRTFHRISSPPNARSRSSHREDRPPRGCSATGYGRRPARIPSRSRRLTAPGPGQRHRPTTDRATRRPARWDRATPRPARTRRRPRR